jgi:glycolate oxidase FAD binding subunit
MAGSLGTLGVILEISLKVLPLPVAEATLAFEKTAAEAIASSNEWAGQPLPVSATAWSGGKLRVRLSGAAAAVDAATRKLGGERIDAVEAERFWHSIREHTDPFFKAPQPLWRLSLKSTTPPLDLPGAQLIEWGGALRWPRRGCAVLRAAPIRRRTRDTVAAAINRPACFSRCLRRW